LQFHDIIRSHVTSFNNSISNLNGTKLNDFKTKGLKLSTNKGLKLQLNLNILTENLLSTLCKATIQILKLTL